MEVSTEPSDGLPRGHVAGVVILTCTALTLFAIAHHPTVRHSTIETGIVQIVRLASLDRLVHGALITITLALDFAFVVFAIRCGIYRQSVIAGLIAYAVGSAAIIGAALVDGFVIPLIAEQYVSLSRGMTAAAIMFSFCSFEIEALTRFGLIATSVAIFAWSVPLARRAGSLRPAGVAGVLSAIVSLVILAMTRTPLDPATLTLLLGAQGIWNVAAAVMLLRRSL